jgi:DNA (cytosine-5)-methyltransferase 1
MKFIDLFCGIGGLSYGFKKAGFTPLLGVDIDPIAGEIYEKFIKPIKGFRKANLFFLKPDSLPDAEIIIGGPPCQGFSSVNGSGRKKKYKDIRNNLVEIYGDIVLAKQPLLFLFENVPPVERSKEFKNLLEKLNKFYKIEYRIVDLGTLGGGPWKPQRPLTHRKRLICIGIKKEVNIKPSDLFPEPGKEGPLPLKELLEIKGKGDSRRRNLSQKLQKLSAYIKPGMKRTDVPENIKQECFYKCWLNTNGFRDVFSRVHPERPLPYITGGILTPTKGPFLHPQEHRGFTVEEAKYIMSFPQELDLKNLPLSRIENYLGNAVPPQSAYAFANRIKEVLNAHGFDI